MWNSNRLERILEGRDTWCFSHWFVWIYQCQHVFSCFYFSIEVTVSYQSSQFHSSSSAALAVSFCFSYKEIIIILINYFKLQPKLQLRLGLNLKFHFLVTTVSVSSQGSLHWSSPEPTSAKEPPLFSQVVTLHSLHFFLSCLSAMIIFHSLTWTVTRSFTTAMNLHNEMKWNQ